MSIFEAKWKKFINKILHNLWVYFKKISNFKESWNSLKNALLGDSTRISRYI